MDRHEVPTHLMVRDKVVFGLTIRQLFWLGTGLAVSFHLWTSIHLDAWHLTIPLRVLSAMLIMGSAAAIALLVIANQTVEAWVSHLLLYVSHARYLVWRPLQQEMAPIGQAREEEDEEDNEEAHP